jgi:hypothetical protein
VKGETMKATTKVERCFDLLKQILELTAAGRTDEAEQLQARLKAETEKMFQTGQLKADC